MQFKKLWRAGLVACVILGSLSPRILARSQSDDANKPIIGVNLDVSGEDSKELRIPMRYAQAIIKAGGIPVLIPPMPESTLDTVLKHIDGIVMIGGDDYPPSLYKQTPDPTTTVMDSERSQFDMELAHRVLRDDDLPVLGICAGCQALNIAAGGDLIQDIPKHNPQSAVHHASEKGYRHGSNLHAVLLDKDCRLSKLLQTTKLNVLSSHHQSVDKVGENLKVVGSADDGIVEAIEGKGDRWLVGLQWHPEKDYDTNKAIFEGLVREAKEHHK